MLSSSPVLTFGEKYESTERRSVIPADIPEEAADTIRGAMRSVAEAFSLRGVVRGDFFLAEDGRVYFNELNTVPGSLAFYLFGDTLIEARDFLVSLVENASLPPEKPPLATGLLSRTRFAGAKVAKTARGCYNTDIIIPKSKGSNFMAKIQMKTPLVEMDGDEMTRILWQEIKDILLTPISTSKRSTTTSAFLTATRRTIE